MDTMKRLYWAIPFAYREAGEREPFDLIDAQNKEILAGLDDPSYLRSSKMDPTMNSAETYIHKADEIIAMYRQGEFPRELAKASVESTRELLARLEKEYSPSIVKPLTQAFNSHFQLWYNEVLKIVPESRFVKELFDSEHKLVDKIEAFNVAMTAEDMKKREKVARGVIAPAFTLDNPNFEDRDDCKRFLRELYDALREHYRSRIHTETEAINYILLEAREDDAYYDLCKLAREIKSSFNWTRESFKTYCKKHLPKPKNLKRRAKSQEKQRLVARELSSS